MPVMLSALHAWLVFEVANKIMLKRFKYEKKTKKKDNVFKKNRVRVVVVKSFALTNLRPMK